MSKIPEYYLGKTGQPAWDAIEEFDLNYNRGCVFKYLVRAGRKTEDSRQDLRKAIRCLERELAAVATDGPVVDAEFFVDERPPPTPIASAGRSRTP